MTPTAFLGACIVDIIIGDPCWFTHPVVIISKFVTFLENKIRRASFIDENNHLVKTNIVSFHPRGFL